MPHKGASTVIVPVISSLAGTASPANSAFAYIVYVPVVVREVGSKVTVVVMPLAIEAITCVLL